ncbi:replication-relaxation family protein [Streptomyces sp. SBC-4]|nr:replication-relaxation family protein [Streptomyces sp. SBC-4]MDV5143252.1 replication-relaxation family protein [Streptomyces sp. SBC-4]
MTTALSPAATSLPRLGQQLLPVLYQHRLVATGQLHRMLTPHAQRPVYLRRVLNQMRGQGLVDCTTRRAGRMGGAELLWFVTPRGADIVEASREVTSRAYRISPETAASQLQEHTLAVVETGLAFSTWAQALGDECGPLDWDPELVHRVRDGENRLGDDALLIPDAVLRYTRTTPTGRRLLTYFLEIDRSTMQVGRLGRKLTSYARYATYVPAPPPGHRFATATGAGREAWRDRYPAVPRLLVVLTGASETVLRSRTEDLRALAAADARVRRTPQLAVGITTLGQLTAQGPFAPIVTPLLGEPTPGDVLLATPSAS